MPFNVLQAVCFYSPNSVKYGPYIQLWNMLMCIGFSYYLIFLTRVKKKKQLVT